jgi:hypothetical protein
VEPSPTVLRGSFERHSELDVVRGLRPVGIDFYDGYTGYVWLLGCDSGCQGALFVTYDGGWSWLERTLPVDHVTTMNVDVVDARTLVLVTGPDAWYRSLDGGRTFVRAGDGQPKPTDTVRGPGVGCATGGECPPSVLVDGKPAPAQPRLPGTLRSVAVVKDGPIYAVSSSDTAATVAKSADGGRSWAPVGGPVPVRANALVRLIVSSDGKDVWLFTGDGGESGSVFLLEPTGWREIRTDLPGGARAMSGAAVGEGALAVPGRRFGYLYADGRWADAGRPTAAMSAHVLSDGTLMTVTSPADIWLGAGNGAARLWNRVTLDPKWR